MSLGLLEKHLPRTDIPVEIPGKKSILPQIKLLLGTIAALIVLTAPLHPCRMDGQC